jgi:hypothetical protein
VIEIAEELVESMDGRQELVLITEVILPELSGRIPERLQKLSEWSGPQLASLRARREFQP